MIKAYSTRRCPLLLLWTILLQYGSESSATPQSQPPLPRLLDETSVVLITGAAGYLGSEVALALHRLYRPKQLILMDSLETAATDLNAMEFKRQRIFRLLQDIGTQVKENDATSTTTKTKTAVSFYRVDVRPAIPEYYDSSDVPVLDSILASVSDPVTHIFHAARSHSATNIIPRSKGLEKAGLMESLLEQVMAWHNRTGTTTSSSLPSFVYVSDINVIGNPDLQSPPPHDDELPIFPQTLAGAAAAIQELIAAHYYDRVPSTALRFSTIYGPWDRHSRVFELVEQQQQQSSTTNATTKTSNSSGNNNNNNGPPNKSEAWYDLVYIDDAVDAVLTALQLPMAVGSIPITSGFRITEARLALYIHEQGNKNSGTTVLPPMVLKPPPRAQELLNWWPRVSLPQGLRNTLDWQADRALPYGSRQSQMCDTYDADCWNGTPIFPCASECANEYHCKSTAWDDVLSYTNSITSSCNAILYTVHLDPHATSIPSAFVRVSTQSKAYIESSSASQCNIAFVAHTSPLFVNNGSVSGGGANTIPLAHQHGFWTLVPVAVTEATFAILSLVPKLSPGLFFGESVRTAIYVDPDILIDDITTLLETVSDGSTVLLTGRQLLDPVKRQRPVPPSATAGVTNTARERAYRMMQIAMLEHDIRLLPSELDTGIIVHGALHDPNVRLFRCDVFAEIVQWKVKGSIGDSAGSSLSFMLSLHDLWSRVVAERSGQPIEWTVKGQQQQKRQRRLEEVKEEDVAIKTAAKSRETTDSVVEDETTIQPKEEKEDETRDEPEKLIDVTAEAGGEQPEQQLVEERPVSNDDDTVGAAQANVVPLQHNGFGVVDAIEAVLGLKQQERTNEHHQADDFVVDDDDKNAATPKYQPVKHDLDDDIVMGILSSPKQQYFARIASLESIGVYRVTSDLLAQHDKNAAAGAAAAM